MSGASRKVKNPLLSAAGEGFPFENYAENAVLVPVTPATPAVLRDDAELDSFVGQEPVKSHNSTLSKASTDADSEFTPIPLNSEENRTLASQPAKQGYLTSILSSLPNLSLSSITGESPGAQASQTQQDASSVHSTNSYVPSHERGDSLRDTSPPIVANFHDPRRTYFTSSDEGRTGSLSTPSQPTLPPTVPSSSNGPISYRLGNQRRLKYAPPPDLTSNISKQHSAPVVLPPFATQSVETPTIFNPNEFGSSDQSYQSVPSPNQSYQSVPLTQSSPSIISTKTQQQVSSTQSLGPSTQSYQPIPSTQSFQSVPLIQSCQSVPSTKSNQSVPLTESNQPVSLTASHQPVPVADSLPPVRPALSHPPVSAVQSHPPIQAVQSHPPVPVAQSHPSAPVVQSNPPVSSTRSQHQSVPSTQSRQPVPLSQTHQPVPSTEDYKSTSSTQSYHSVPLIHSYQSAPFIQSNQTVLSTQSHQRYRPILSTQCHQPVPLTQSYQCVPLTQSSQSVPSPQSNYHAGTSVISKSPSIQGSTSEYVSESNSLQESFRSSPVTTGVPQNSIDTSQRVSPQNKNPINESGLHFEKSRSSLSFGQPFASQPTEPSTPQNTPANVSFFGFDGYTDQRGLPRTLNSEKQTAVVTDKNSTRVDSVSENTVTRSTSETKPTVTFAPVSAVQVSEKLKHLLAEQKEHLSDEVSATKVVENKADDQTVKDPSDVKLNDSENKGDSSGANILKDAFTRQEASEPIRSILNPQEPTAAYERIDASQSHGVSSTVQQSTLQYFQTQSLASSVDFFAEKPSTDQRSSLNLAHTQSASTFFNLSGIDSPFTGAQYQQSNTNVDLTTTVSSRHDLQHPSLSASVTSGLISPSTYAPCSTWGGKQPSILEAVDGTCSSSIQSSYPPLFYNPAQFQSESHRYSYGSPTLQPTANLSQTYFDNLSGAGHSQNTFGGVTSAFFPVSVAMTTVPEPTGSATLSPVQMSVNPLAGRNNTDSVPSSFQNLSGPSDRRIQYRAVYHHWFYRKEVEHKVLWLPFSMQDSLRLEEVHNSTEITPETTVATDGGRYDVDILRRQRSPVYWNGATTEVRRCSWFYKGPTESRYVPYDESTAAKLEEEYKQAYMSNKWNRRIDLNNGEYIVFHSATVQVHYLTPSSPELAASWGNSAGSEDSTYLQGASTRPRVIKRGLDDFHIEDGEPEKVDHLLFLVHGIGSVCDLKFRSVEEVVDEFRSISLQLVQSHYRTASEQRIVNRIEVLPISWHTTLHSEDTGIDKKLQAITLESIPKLRHFTNDTLLDILFYTSPVYCQTIMQTVASEINRLYTLFKDRNPDFNGGIYLGGHSLGSLILFDLLCHQKPSTDDKSSENNDEFSEDQNNEEIDPTQALSNRILKRRLSKKISYVIGAAGTGQPYIHYPQLIFHPRAFFAFGSPIGMFVTVRGIDMLGEDFILPTCPAFFNIFHPFDPVAYRVEALINPEAYKYRPMLIPHHKGRKRMHLELKETMARVGADLKQKVIDSVRNTWNSVYQLALFHRSDNSVLEREIDKVVEEQLQQTPTVTDQQSNDDGGAEFKVGILNGGRRIDYVLQEAPFEYINEYIFALTSHVCYWESEDTMLLILKEMYGSTGIQTDAQLPQQTLSIERTSPSPTSISATSTTTKCDVRSSIPVLGMDPTAPIAEKTVGPPPKAGFVRKS